MSIVAKSKGEITYKDLTGVHKWFLIVLISMGSSVVYTPMYLKNIFYDPLMTAIGCTNADLGMMVSMYGIAAVICYLPSGIVADKFRMRTLATVGFIGTAVLTFVYAMLPSLFMCYIIFLGMGITSILIWWGTRFKVIRLCCEEDEYSQRIGVSYSLYGITGLIVGLINTAIVASFADTVVGVRVMIIFLGVILTIMGVLSYFLIPDFKGEISKNAALFDLKDAKEAFTWPGVIWAAATMFCIYAVYQGATYTTPYMSQVYGASEHVVDIVGLVRTYGIGLLAGPFFGYLATKFGSASKTIVLGFLVSVGLLIGFILVPDTAGVAVIASMIVLFGFTTYGCFSIGSAPLSEVQMPMRIFGTSVGLLSVVGFMPDMFIHTFYGSLIDTHGFDAYPIIFSIEAGLAVLGVVFLLLLMRSIKKSRAGVANSSSDEA